MCGIVGYVGYEQAAPILLKGLEKLEYRGYDSSGIAIYKNNIISMVKAKGRLSNLIKMTDNGKSLDGTMGIGHTRWATHGEPNDINSHPHISNSGKFAVVHNGIIENYLELREFLIERNFHFLSQTDTEVVAHLLEYYYTGDILDTIRKVLNKLKGSYALGVISSQHPDQFFAVRKDSPLVIGLCESANYIASDMPAILEYTKTFYLLEEKEVAVISADSVKIYNHNKELIIKEPFTVDWDISSAEKGGYEHFMIKEIHDQPKAISDTITPRIKNDEIALDGIKLTDAQIKNIKKINIIGCGSAYHAGIIGKYFIEKVCRITTEVDLASEFRYRDPIVDSSTLTVIISQSGETADTLAALREAKKRGSRIFSIVNVVGSSIARESNDVLYTWAGPEIAVATTKGYTTQVTAIYLLGLYIAKSLNSIDSDYLTRLLSQVKNLPKLVEKTFEQVKEIQYLASTYSSVKDVFFIGRGMDYAVAMEGSLKLKEISYIHAEAYAAGELKHGTISLIENGTLVIAVATDEKLFEKTLSNIKEVKTRGATIITLASEGNIQIGSESDHTIFIPKIDGLLSPSLSVIVLQLFGYYIAATRGCDIDKPRNLAKSVTVE